MTRDLEPLLEKLEQADCLADLQACIVLFRDHFAVDHIVYHWVSIDGEQFGCGTYSAEWAQHYTDKNYVRVDPVVTGCFHRFHPVDWKRLDWGSRAARALRKEAQEFGIGNQGYTVPVRGPGGQFALFTVSHDCDDEAWATFTSSNQRDLILLAHVFNQRGLHIMRGRVPEPVKPLSPREVDALTFLAMGYGRGQVAEMLSISEHTLRVYIESARFKLNALNTTHAVARALSEGLIVVGGSARRSTGDWPGKSLTPQAAE